MRVSVFGLGYVGCVTASCLAKDGHEILGVDVNEEKVAMVNKAVSPIVERGLGELLSNVVLTGRLRATTSSEEAVRNSDLALICVGTPGSAGGRPDFSAIGRVGKEIGSTLSRYAKPYPVVLRSTVLPGTTKDVLVPAILAETGRAFQSRMRVAVNPEFMREGSSLADFKHPPLTLVGCDDPETTAVIRSLYAGVEAPFITTAIRTAEMMKYVSNAFHALKICFANEVGDLCAALGADPHEVMRIFMMDRKLNISEAYLKPGFAFGGSCLPKDLRALLYAARRADMSLPLLSSIPHSNEGQIRYAVETVLETRKRRVGVVGLSFKPGTDDLRESPMVALVETLIGKGCEVRILDRNVSLARLTGANRRYIEEEIPHIGSLMCGSAEELLMHAQIVVIGNVSDEAALVAGSLQPHHVVIDVTRGVVEKLLNHRREVEIRCVSSVA